MTAVEDQTAQLTVVDRLLRIFAEADEPIGYRRIAKHPLTQGLGQPSIVRGLSIAARDRLIREVRLDVFELTDAGRAQLPAEPPL